MKALLDALKTKFDGTSSLTTAFAGGMWHLEPKEGTAMPYLLYQVVSAPTQLAYGSTLAPVTMANVLIQFVGWVEGDNAAALSLTKMETLHGVLDTFTPTLASGRCVNVQRITDPIAQMPEPDTALNAAKRIVRGARLEYLYTITP